MWEQAIMTQSFPDKRDKWGSSNNSNIIEKHKLKLLIQKDLEWL